MIRQLKRSPAKVVVFLTLCSALFSAHTQAADEAATQVQLQTSEGNIVITLNTEKAPKSVANFVQYVEDGFYDGTIFHRVIDGFMIQGGGFTPKYERKKTRAPINNEADNGLVNDKYSIAMARTSDPHSATAQFFINTTDNVFLNHSAKNQAGWGYTVFGVVTQGEETVDKIGQAATGPGGPFRSDVPKSTVVIEKAELLTTTQPAVE